MFFASQEHLCCLCVLLELHAHLPGMQRCAAGSKDAGHEGFVHFETAEWEGRWEMKPPASPCSHHFGLSSTRQGSEGSPEDPWRDQDPVLSRVMKCEPFPQLFLMWFCSGLAKSEGAASCLQSLPLCCRIAQLRVNHSLLSGCMDSDLFGFGIALGEDDFPDVVTEGFGDLHQCLCWG